MEFCYNWCLCKKVWHTCSVWERIFAFFTIQNNNCIFFCVSQFFLQSIYTNFYWVTNIKPWRVFLLLLSLKHIKNPYNHNNREKFRWKCLISMGCYGNEILLSVDLSKRLWWWAYPHKLRALTSSRDLT